MLDSVLLFALNLSFHNLQTSLASARESVLQDEVISVEQRYVRYTYVFSLQIFHLIVKSLLSRLCHVSIKELVEELQRWKIKNTEVCSEHLKINAW